MKKIALLIFSVFFNLSVQAAVSLPTIPKILNASQQLIMVRTSEENSFQGELQRYQRENPSLAWRAIGKPITVVVGKKGLAWGQRLELMKREGDNRSPLGFYTIGPLFGFKEKPAASMKMPYFALNADSVCVDDEKSQYYNQLLDASKVAEPDWHSAEKMRAVTLYQQGAVIQYNTEQTKPGRGSCIFLHRWRGPQQGTAGCVAMDPEALNSVLNWLNASQKPVIAILTESVYQKLLNKVNIYNSKG